MIARLMLLLALVLLPTLALAQAPSPAFIVQFEPAAPVGGQLVRVALNYSGCSVPRPGTAGVTTVGSVVTLSETIDELICGTPPPGPTLSLDLGYFAPGNYTFVYAARSPVQGITYQPVTRGFTVGAASVPMASSAGYAAFGLALLLAAAWQLRRRLQRRQASPVAR